jgi:predicted Na+-dependent transporter
MKAFIEHHFGTVLILSCVAGLVVPGLPSLPDVAALVTLALLTFVACYRLRDGGMKDIRWRDITIFYVLRYTLLPLGMWYVAHITIPDYATSVLLLTLLPSAISSPAFTHIFGGIAIPAFAITVLSQVAAPFMIPAAFALVGSTEVVPPPHQLFTTLVWCIFMPMLIYGIVRNHHKSATIIHANGKFFSILLVAFIIALAVAKQRDVILGDPEAIIAATAVTTTCYVLYLIFGWVVSHRRPREERITYATCSGFNNAAMGVSLALMHFSPPVILFVAASEISWAILPSIFKWGLRLTAR